MVLKMNFRRGFTFIEILLSVLIIGIIASVAAKILITGLDVYSLIVNRDNAFQNARVAVDRMMDELLLIGSGQITYASNTRISFRDVDNIATNFRSTTVSSEGQTETVLLRGDDLLARNVQSLDFDYYNIDGAATIWLWQIRLIDVELGIQALADAGIVRLHSAVFPRNFMYSGFQ